MVVYRERNQIMNPCVVQYNENKKNLKQKKKRAFDIYFTLLYFLEFFCSWSLCAMNSIRIGFKRT